MARKIIGVSLAPEAYAKLRLLGSQLGLKDSQAAKHLIMMSLQQLMGQLQQLEQSSLIKEMTETLNRELGMVDVVLEPGHEEAMRRRVIASAGHSNTGTKGQKCPPESKRKGVKKGEKRGEKAA